MVDRTTFQKRLDKLTREIGELTSAANQEAAWVGLDSRMHVSFEYTELGAEVRLLIEQFAIEQISAYAQVAPTPYTMTLKYTDQPIFDELIGDLWDKAYKQGIEDERTADSLGLGIGANRTNPYRSL